MSPQLGTGSQEKSSETSKDETEKITTVTSKERIGKTMSEMKSKRKNEKKKQKNDCMELAGGLKTEDISYIYLLYK